MAIFGVDQECSQIFFRAAKSFGGGEICAAHDLSPFFFFLASVQLLGVAWDKQRLKTSSSTQHDMKKSLQSTEESQLGKLARKSSKLFRRKLN